MSWPSYIPPMAFGRKRIVFWYLSTLEASIILPFYKLPISTHSSLSRGDGNNWNYNFMPGLEAVYGYNMVNVSLYDVALQKEKKFFPKPVLIKTLYYPAFSQDMLNYEPVSRRYYLVSAYDEDTNGDGAINIKDLRRFYLFDIHGTSQGPLVPKDYSVYKSEYDPANDLMYVFAKLDENTNGRRDEYEPIHVYWVDLKDPLRTGRLY